MQVPELRCDPVTGNRVFVAAGRDGRPRTVSALLGGRAGRSDPKQLDPACPFCPGNEQHTLGEIARTGSGPLDGPGWRVRAFPNRFPVVDATGAHGATGACEVVVFSPRHDRDLQHLDEWHVAEVLEMLRQRVAAHLAAGRVSPQVFVNHGGGSGASIAHPHAQLIALDIVPPALDLELTHLAAQGADTLDLDRRHAERAGLLVLDGDLVAWTPWTTPLPYTVRIAPRGDVGPFVEATPQTVRRTAVALRQVLRAIAGALDSPSYNVVLHVDAARDRIRRRWRLEVIPRIVSEGGFERGSGLATNASDPVREAAVLRAQLAGQVGAESGVECTEREWRRQDDQEAGQ